MMEITGKPWLLNASNTWLQVYALLACMFLVACNLTANNNAHLTARQVPPVYLAANNPNFNTHQDTLYTDNQLFSGYVYQLFPNGDTEFVKGFINGLEEGIQKSWHNNGQLAERRFYTGGKKQGVQQSWWPNGRQRFSYTATKDEYNGELKEWDEKGMLYIDFNYTNGQEEGSEKMWWPDGSIRANYVIHNGKRYGLLGMKLCANPIDSVKNMDRER